MLAFKEISDHFTHGHTINKNDGFVASKNRSRTPKRTRSGWELLVEWKDGSSDWVPLKDLKDTGLVELVEYAVANNILEEPAIVWWVSFCLNKLNRIIHKVKSKYWQKTHKDDIKLPKMAEEALQLDRINGNDYWELAIKNEMVNARVA